MIIKLYVCCVVFMTLVTAALSVNSYKHIDVNLNNQEPGNTTIDFYDVQNTKHLINVFNINPNVSFFVIQLHTYVESITLSFEYPLQSGTHVNGTNTGLVWSEAMGINGSIGRTVQFYLLRQAAIYKKVKVMLAVSTYSKNDPIPGGCNLEFETMIAPYQKINYNNDVITVSSQPPSKNDVFCHKDGVITDMYYMYLREYDNDTEEYFLGLQKMMTVDNIVKYGTKVPSGIGHSKFKQMYNLYRGTGRIFAVISSLDGRTSAYIPTISFGCDLKNWLEECVGPVGTQWKLLCAFFLILGVIVCFKGHTYFKVGLFTMGFTFGAVLTLVLVSLDLYFSDEVNAMFSLGTGIVFGILWFLVWWQFGIPIISIQLTILLAGFLFTSIVLYSNIGGIFNLSDDVYFWLLFIAITLPALLPTFLYPSICHIVSLSLLGSYAIVVAMNYYVGGNLPYILINAYRRMAVTDFKFAIVDPPYQFIDFTQTVFWALLFGLGIFYQYKQSIGKPPFPPHRTRETAPIINERSPLIQPEREYPPAYSA